MSVLELLEQQAPACELCHAYGPAECPRHRPPPQPKPKGRKPFLEAVGDAIRAYGYADYLLIAQTATGDRIEGHWEVDIEEGDGRLRAGSLHLQAGILAQNIQEFYTPRANVSQNEASG